MGFLIVMKMNTGLIQIFIVYFVVHLLTGIVTRLTRQVPLVKQELLNLPEHLSSPPVFSGVRVTRSLVLYVCFVDRCLSFCTFSFDHLGILMFISIKKNEKKQ
jgi:branched-subunit amino acid transport protein